MHEREFQQRYRALQEETRAPQHLIEETTRKARATIEDRAPRITKNPGGTRQRECSTARAPRRKIRPLSVISAAACLALAVVIGFTAFDPWHAEPSPDSFTVKAYAIDSDTVIEPASDDLVAFVLDKATLSQQQDVSSAGAFTGMFFTVEGEGIERVQATLSGGELYSCTSQELDRASQPDAVREALGWKPAKRGAGEFFGDYDYVSVLSAGGELDHNDASIQVRLLKLLGSTVDIALPSEEHLQLGLWFSDAQQDSAGRLDLESLSGQQLIITACFRDGSAQTQTIELSAGWFATEALPYAAESNIDRRPVGDPLSEAEAQALPDACHTLYGKVISTENVQHPYPLEHANEHADAPMAPEPLALPSYGSTALATMPSDERILPPSDIVSFQALASTDQYDDLALCELSASDATAYVTDRLPEGYDLDEDTQLAAFGGDRAYLNECRMQTNGWAIEADGALSEGNSFIVVDLDITSASTRKVYLHPSLIGGICALDKEADSASYALAGIFATTNGSERAYPWDATPLAPGETRHIQLVYIADDTVADADEVAFVTTLIEPQGLDMQALASASYISFGKLERR